MVPSLGLKILYVEDDLDIQEALREVLEFAGYQVTIASTASAGLEALRKERFHLVISDYNLPDFSGGKMLTLAAQAGLLNCESVILTGASMLDGTAGYRVIRKPIDVDKFLLRIHEILAPVRDEEFQKARASLERTVSEEQRQGKPASRVELVLYISEASPASLRALRNLEKLLSRYEPSQFLLQVIDLSRERPASLDEDRIAFTPTLVKRTPAPRIYLLGSLEHIQAVEDLLSDAKVERR
jgi:DNA-binding response OmpR family regulator